MLEYISNVAYWSTCQIKRFVWQLSVILSFVTVISKEVCLHWQPAANLIAKRWNFRFHSNAIINIFSELFGENDWSWPDSKVDQGMSSFGFCYRLGYPVPFVLDTSPKSIDREGLGESRAGTRQPIIGKLEKLEFRCVSSPLQGAYNYPMSRLSRRFHRPIYF